MVCFDADAMRPVDVGLTPELPYFRLTTARRTPPITYLHLFECDKFSVSKILCGTAMQHANLINHCLCSCLKTTICRWGYSVCRLQV